jgi:hypothetical protein
MALLMCGDTSESYPNDDIANFCATPTKDYTYYIVTKKVNSMAVVFHALDEPFPIDPVASALKVYLDICSYLLTRLSSITTLKLQGRLKSWLRQVDFL